MEKFHKRVFSRLKKEFRKLKYLDRTRASYFVITGFIATFCLFTSTTYSYFNFTKTINAATITIANLRYSLSSTNSSYTNGDVTIAANTKIILTLTLSSLNDFETKYALHYDCMNPNIGVYYSEEAQNNMKGNIAAKGTVTLRVVIVNNSETSSKLTFTVLGGYVKNALDSNITEGYYENDFVVRTVLLNDGFTNGTISTSFPAKNSEYAYYKSECSEHIDAQWDAEAWKLNLNGVTKQGTCDVYFKRMSNSDIEASFAIINTDGSETYVEQAPAITTYPYVNAVCNNATASYNSTTMQVKVSGIKEKTACTVYFGKTGSLVDTIKSKANAASITNYEDGVKTEMYTFKQPATGQTGALTDYRYIGANPNNYITFNGETWRIVGVFNVDGVEKIKIIKGQAAGNLPFSTGSSDWLASSLVSALNNDYYNNTGVFEGAGLTATARSQIAYSTWYLGGGTLYRVSGYAGERGITVQSGRSTSTKANIGLLYPSDYLFTFANGIDAYCSDYGYNCIPSRNGDPTKSWIYNAYRGGTWTFQASASDSSVGVIFITDTGYIGFTSSSYPISDNRPVGPALYLRADIEIKSGQGTSSKPYQIQ